MNLLSTSRSWLSVSRPPLALPTLSLGLASPRLGLTLARFRSVLAPRKVEWPKRQKRRLPVPTGGATKGTTLSFGDYGIRIKGNGARLTQKQLLAAEDAIKRKIKVVKGAKCYMRVFPDLPICIKGNETRMGKGKGTFEYWAVRVPPGRVLFEIGGAPIRVELAREALRQACHRLPTMMEFIDRTAVPRLGNLLLEPQTLETSSPVTAKA